MNAPALRHHYLALPKRKTHQATVLIFPTWTGLSDFERQFSDTLAEKGFTALAIDLYGIENNPKSLEEKSEKMALLTQNYNALYQHLTDLVDEALTTLVNKGQTTNQPIYSLGFCLGGKLSLMAGLTHLGLRKAVSLHGLLDAPIPKPPRNTHCQFLICNGHQDPMVSSEQRDTFLAMLDKEKLDWQLIEFSNTMHSFMLPEADNPKNGVQYNSLSAHRALGYITHFLKSSES